MRPLVVRLGLLVLGMGLIEIGLGDAVGRGSLLAWALIVLVGLPLVLAGTAGFIGPLFASGRDKGDAERE